MQRGTVLSHNKELYNRPDAYTKMMPYTKQILIAASDHEEH